MFLNIVDGDPNNLLPLNFMLVTLLLNRNIACSVLRLLCKLHMRGNLENFLH